MKKYRLWLFGVTLLQLCLIVGGVVALADDTRIRWDLVTIDFSTGTLSEGGVASALANDGSGITLTGSGSFTLDDDDADNDASGGGNFVTFNSAGEINDHGTYRVTELVSFHLAPGALNPATIDTIGRSADARAGLALLRIRYSDRSQGVLTVSCRLTGTAASVFEGITTSKGFVTYWNRLPDEPGVDGNRTLFHVVGRDD